MNEILREILHGSGFMPHGHCYLWTPGLVWLHVLSDALIALAYYSIPITLVTFVRRRKDLTFSWMFVCFAAFILACGTTHLVEIWNVWHSNYWIAGGVKALTALASVPTAILLVRLVPMALALASPEQLRRANEAMEAEILIRRQTEEEVRRLNAELERRVAERTAELYAANEELTQQIADRIQAEEAVRRLNAELEQRVHERTSELETANKELEAFSYSVSHDLRAPLRTVDGYSQALLEDYGEQLPEEGHRYVATIRRGAQNMGVLIDDLLEFSRLGRTPLRAREVNVRHLVDEALDELSLVQKSRTIDLRIGDLPPCHGDPVLLKQVWINLLSNAFKYSRNVGTAVIEIGSEPEPEGVAYYVRDNGAGFDMRYADKLFGVFQRLHGAGEFEGTGVGLAIVQRIVHRHGGRVWAEAEVGRGATFHFSVENGKEPNRHE